MAWRSTLGSPVKMQLLRFPTMEEEEGMAQDLLSYLDIVNVIHLLSMI